MKRKKSFLIICLLLLLLVGFIIVFLFKGTGNNILLPKDNSAEEWNGDQKLSSGEKSDEKTIKIPGISSLVFIANQKEQKVNFYNPKENTCLFRMTLYIEESQYWQSGYIDPGKMTNEMGAVGTAHLYSNDSNAVATFMSGQVESSNVMYNMFDGLSAGHYTGTATFTIRLESTK